MKITRALTLLMHVIPSTIRIIPCLFKKAKIGRAKVVFRFDDYGVWCNTDWLSIEEQVMHLHEKYNVKITFGVIPDSIYPLNAHILSPSVYPKDYECIEKNNHPLIHGSNRVEKLKKSVAKGISEIALHGYNHPKGYSNYYNTEFYGESYDVQYSKLKKGKSLLEDLFGVNIKTFIPPHNTYDNLTLDLLEEFGFSIVSARSKDENTPVDRRLNIHYLWYTTADVDYLFKEISHPRHYVFEPINIIMLHHTNFTTNGHLDQAKIDNYEKLLKYIANNAIQSFTLSSVPYIEEQILEIAFSEATNNLFYRILKGLHHKGASNLIEKKYNNL